MGRFLDWLFPSRVKARKAVAEADFDAAWEKRIAESREIEARIDARIARVGAEGFYAFVRSRGFGSGQGQPNWVWMMLLSEYEAMVPPLAATHEPDRHIH